MNAKARAKGVSLTLRIKRGQRQPIDVRETKSGNIIVTANIKTHKKLCSAAIKAGHESAVDYLVQDVLTPAVQGLLSKTEGGQGS